MTPFRLSDGAESLTPIGLGGWEIHQDGLREGAGKTTLPNGVVHSGMYKAGWVDFSAKCSLNVPDGAGEESNSLDEGEHIGVLNKDLTFVLAKSRFGRSSAIDVVPLLGADSLLTSQR